MQCKAVKKILENALISSSQQLLFTSLCGILIVSLILLRNSLCNCKQDLKQWDQSLSIIILVATGSFLSPCLLYQIVTETQCDSIKKNPLCHPSLAPGPTCSMGISVAIETSL